MLDDRVSEIVRLTREIEKQEALIDKLDSAIEFLEGEGRLKALRYVMVASVAVGVFVGFALSNLLTITL